MNMKLQRAIDNENLEMSRDNLKEFTGKLKPKSIKVTDEVVDLMYLNFINNNPNIEFRDMIAIKDFIDFIKKGGV